MTTTVDGLNRFVANNTSSNETGVTLMNTPEGEIIARIMGAKPNVSIRHLPSSTASISSTSIWRRFRSGWGANTRLPTLKK